MTKKFFEYDHLIDETNFCNFSRERLLLREHLEKKDSVKILGPRNFGKTSLIKNIIAPQWEAANPKQRMVIYADFYSVESLEDISRELSLGLNKAFSTKKTLMDRSSDWIRAMTKVRPVWTPSTTGDGLGEFSIRTENNESTIDFELIFENIQQLCRKKEVEFLIILDEFQEVAKVKRAEAKLRNSLQILSSQIPVVILGSKQHILNEIFNKPKAPFYSWGYTLEMSYIPFLEYHVYINERLESSRKHLSQETSIYLQKKLHRIPESINRLCDFISRDSFNEEITPQFIDQKMREFVEQSRSLYEEVFANLKSNSKKVLVALAVENEVSNLTGQAFLRQIPELSKTGVADITKRLLDDSVISRSLNASGDFTYRVSDPFLCEFLRNYKAFLF